MSAQLSLPFDPPTPPAITRPCWMEECPCQNAIFSREHEMWFNIRWYVKHLLVHKSSPKYLRQVREWIRRSQPAGRYPEGGI